MKKILGISLVAMMAVTAANADIASKAYVNQQDTATLTSAEGYTDTKIGALGNVPNTQTPYANVKAYVDDKVQAAESAASGGIADLDGATTGETGVLKSVVQTNGIISGTTAAIVAADIAEGAVTSTGILDGTIVNADISGEAAIAPSKIATDASNRFVSDTEKSTWTGKQDALTFDSEPTASSTNPVTSGGVYTAINAVSATVAGLNSEYATDTELSSGLALKEDVISSTNKVDVAFIDETNYATSGLKTTLDAAYDAAGAATAAVGALDVDTHTGSGNVVSSVTQTNGAIAVEMNVNAVTVPTGQWGVNDTDGTYALTASKTGDVISYHWELIDRGTTPVVEEPSGE